MNFQLLDKHKKKIIILDDLTSRWIKYCIPENINFEELKTRRSIPIIFSIKFLLNLIYYSIKTKKFYLSFFISVILEKKTEIVITFTDNNNLISNLGEEIKDILCISIQNGTRYKSIKTKSFTDIKKFHSYYSWGCFEKKLIENNGGNIERNYIVGSLKYGIYKKFFKNKLKNKRFITFISQWRPGKNSVHNFLYHPYEKKNLINIYKYCEINSLNFKICPNFNYKTNEFKEEFKYYSQLIPNIHDHLFIKNDDIDTYMISEYSEIIINHHSSVGFEFMGIDKKILFLGNRKSNLNYEPGWEENLMLLPNQLKIFNDSETELLNKLDALYKMNIKDYLTLIKESKKQYMIYQKEFAHEIIKKNIKDYLV